MTIAPWRPRSRLTTNAVASRTRTPVFRSFLVVAQAVASVTSSVLLQLVGPKVANHVRHHLHDSWPERFPLSQTLASLAEGGDVVVVDNAPRSIDELHTAVLEGLADESRHILEDGVVAEAADIDTCLLLGAGFPFWLGGITKHLDQTGVSERVVGRPLAELGTPS